MMEMKDFQLQKVVSERDVCRTRVNELETALQIIANYTTTEEGDCDMTEEAFGISAIEVIEMAHDEMIRIARYALSR